MSKRILLAVLLLALLMVNAATAQHVTVVQPVPSQVPASELALLQAAIASLGETLETHPWAARRSRRAGDWSAADFARYTAGVLETLGYTVRLAYGTAPSDPESVWLLVAVLVNGTTYWVPVEPSPPTGGATQMALGHVPLTADGVYDSRYVAPAQSAGLPSAPSPIARFRVYEDTILRGANTELNGFRSSSPSGEIVLYVWEIGGSTTVLTTRSLSHVFQQAGSHKVTLTVVDRYGRSATTSETITVEDPDAVQDENGDSGGGCGCGN